MVDITLIKKLDIFKPLNTRDLEKIAKIIDLRKIKKGEYLFKQGDLRNEFFIVLSGQIKLSQNNNKNEEGWAILKKDDFICANALIDFKSAHTQSAFAIEDAEILIIKGIEFKKMAEKEKKINDAILKYLIRGLNEHLRHSTNKLVTVYKTGQIASEETDLENAGGKILKIILQVIKAKKAVFAVYDKYKNASVILTTEGFSKSEEIKGKKIPLIGDGVMRYLFSHEGIYKTMPEDGSLLKEYKVQKAIASPMIFDREVVGMILLGDKISGEFSINNEILLKLITAQIAGSVYWAGKREEQKAEEEMGRTYISH